MDHADFADGDVVAADVTPIRFDEGTRVIPIGSRLLIVPSWPFAPRPIIDVFEFVVRMIRVVGIVLVTPDVVISERQRGKRGSEGMVGKQRRCTVG